ncbi:hypothetical protein RHGRI_000750 [Rhododendron griersonianum]|uniref:STAS domain-containing protein n=1 Tax=Rhododendron griersonianum TaxID=479676 RepID=A0AAV6LKX5_9ERIC|nr:hypothetical protein RHGRI_000750 [Rhododendron griersonianum]
MTNARESCIYEVNYATPRSFGTALKSDLKETLFPDDPFHEFRNEPPSKKAKKAVQYFVPIFEWLPKYSLRFFKYDLLAGITIASLAIPQGISYAKLANLPPIIGLYSSFVPPLVYAVFGSSKHLAVGTVAACSLLIGSIIGQKVSPVDEPELYLHLVFTATFFTGILQAAMGFLRYVKQKKPKLFWVSAIAPMVVVLTGCLFAYFAHAEKHGIQIVGDLKKGINPLSIQHLNFDPKYIAAPIQAAIITAMVALAEGIAIGRSFAILKNEQVDGNKEMIAFGFMNLVGSFTSCYLTTGPFSKTAVNFNAGCKTAMANVVMAACMLLTLLFLAPMFSYTPLVALSAIIMSAMLGLIEYEKAYRLFKTDKYDFLICMAAFLGVAFISMDVGLMLSVGLAILRALLYVARPATCKLGSIPNSSLYRDIEQYPEANGIPGILVLQLGSPIYFPNCNYIRERILRWVRDEQASRDADQAGSVTCIDITGVETLIEILKALEAKGIKMALVNPRLEVMEKLIVTKFIDTIGKENVFLSIDDAIEASRFNLKSSK